MILIVYIGIICMGLSTIWMLTSFVYTFYHVYKQSNYLINNLKIGDKTKQGVIIEIHNEDPNIKKHYVVVRDEYEVEIRNLAPTKYENVNKFLFLL